MKMKFGLKNFIKKLFCKHNYYLIEGYYESTPLPGPTRADILIYECNKCGKRHIKKMENINE